jgi:hypothetical protein
MGREILKVGLTLSLLAGLATVPNRSEADNIIDPANPPVNLKYSALIEFLARRKTSVIPYPNVRLMQELAYEDFTPIAMFIPRGRSAQAPSTDELKPRTVIAPFSANKIPSRIPIGFEDYSALPGNDWEGRLLIGHADRAKKAEVFSWNRKTGINDLFEVSNYGTPGMKQVLAEVTDRERCTKCHQSEAAIFPPQPWSEAITHDPLVTTEIDTLTQQFTQTPILYQKDGILITKEITPFANNTGLAYGIASFTNNRLLQASTVIRDLCGTDLECRRYILMAAIFSATQSNYIRKNVSAGPQPLTFDFTAPTNALIALKGKGPEFFELRAKLLYPRWNPSNYAYANEFIPDISQLVGATATVQDIDPTTPRAQLRGVTADLLVPYLLDTAFDAMGFNFQDSLELQTIPPAERMRLLTSASGSGVDQKLLTDWPPTREDVMQFYRDKGYAKAFGASVNDLSGGGDGQSTVASSNNDKAAASANAISPLFGKYCLECHKANTDNPYIGFHDLNALLQDTSTAKKINRRLVAESMPPNDDSVPKPTDAERKLMADYFAGNAAASVPQAGSGNVKYLNYMGVRVLKRDEAQFSFILPNPGVKIVKNQRSGMCGDPLPRAMERDTRWNPFVITGIGSDGKNYMALENFPYYFPGNMTQTFPLTDIHGFCTQASVTKNGALVSLFYNRDMRSVAVSPMTQQNNTNIVLAYVGGEGGNLLLRGPDGLVVNGDEKNEDDLKLAIGTDGKIYRITNVDYKTRTYCLTEIQVTGGTVRLFWTRLAVDTSRPGTVLAEAATNELVRLRWDRSGNALRIVERGVTRQFASMLEPSLTDKTSLLVVPGKYNAKRNVQF